MSKSVVVHGPQACGKTRNAEALRKHYGLTSILDDWNPHERLPLRDTLVLTNANPESLGLHSLGVDVIAFEQAIEAVAAEA